MYVYQTVTKKYSSPPPLVPLTHSRWTRGKTVLYEGEGYGKEKRGRVESQLNGSIGEQLKVYYDCK